MTVLVTGAAGFIGYHLCNRLLRMGKSVVGLDNFNYYYNTSLKRHRIEQLQKISSDRFSLVEVDFSNAAELDQALSAYDFEQIVHLGGQPGVRFSIDRPREYIQSNVLGHLNILEIAKSRSILHMIYASSSSIYGARERVPFCVDNQADWPVSIYAATKRSDELMSEAYSHLFRIPLTGLRFFTVYGPWGRPDMAMWLFTDAILNDRPITLYNHGDMRRDFTYIDDVVSGICVCLYAPPIDDHQKKPGGSISPHRIYNIGNNRSETLGRLIELIENAVGKKAIRKFDVMQPGDLPETCADISAISNDFGFRPSVGLEVGVPQFVNWLKEYQGLD